jgi:hypothetical protein
MKRITNANYRSDKYYPRVVRAVAVILDRQGFVAPIELFIEMGLLDKQGVAAWRKGQIPYLERVIHQSCGRQQNSANISASRSRSESPAFADRV